MDILLLKQNAHVVCVANQIIGTPDDCLMVLEVKDNATGNDIRDYNNKIDRIKMMPTDSYPLSGMFCYKIKLVEKTILKRFGFTYDHDTNFFYDEYNVGADIDGLVVQYPNIDFLISIEIDEEGIFLMIQFGAK